MVNLRARISTLTAPTPVPREHRVTHVLEKASVAFSVASTQNVGQANPQGELDVGLVVTTVLTTRAKVPNELGLLPTKFCAEKIRSEHSLIAVQTRERMDQQRVHDVLG